MASTSQHALHTKDSVGKKGIVCSTRQAHLTCAWNQEHVERLAFIVMFMWTPKNAAQKKASMQVCTYASLRNSALLAVVAPLRSILTAHSSSLPDPTSATVSAIFAR
jgi:hypothetical protein